jgi:hypothetical protein
VKKRKSSESGQRIAEQLFCSREVRVGIPEMGTSEQQRPDKN